MNFQRIKYLEWVKENLQTVEHDLASASVTPCRLEDLDLDPSELALSGRNYYGLPELVDAIATTYEVPTKNIVITHGGSMGIFLAMTARIDREDEVLLEVPNYEPFYRIPKALGARVKILERSFDNRYELNLEQLERKISSRTEAVLLTNLHNPSGVALNEEKIETICQICRENGASLICGEAYLESVLEHQIPPAFQISDQAISIGSMSKAYGLGGLRVGWIFCDEELKSKIHSLENYVSPHNTYIAQEIAVQALKQREDLLQRGKKLVRENFDILSDWVDSREDVEWVPPDGGPICFFKIPKKVDVWELMKQLKKEYNTLVVPGDFFWAKGFIRVGFGNKPDHVRKGIENLGEALDELKTRRGFVS